MATVCYMNRADSQAQRKRVKTFVISRALLVYCKNGTDVLFLRTYSYAFFFFFTRKVDWEVVRGGDINLGIVPHRKLAVWYSEPTCGWV